MNVPRPLIAMLTVAVGLSGFAHAALAQDANTQDLRCLVVAIEMSSSVDEQIRAAATTVGAYFLGRLDGRSPGLDIQTRAAEEMMRMKPEELDPEVNRCTAAMGPRGQVISDLAGRLAQGR